MATSVNHLLVKTYTHPNFLIEMRTHSDPNPSLTYKTTRQRLAEGEWPGFRAVILRTLDGPSLGKYINTNSDWFIHMFICFLWSSNSFLALNSNKPEETSWYWPSRICIASMILFQLVDSHSPITLKRKCSLPNSQIRKATHGLFPYLKNTIGSSHPTQVINKEGAIFLHAYCLAESHRFFI